MAEISELLWRKKRLRAELRNLRRGLEPSYRQAADEVICEKLKEQPEYRNARLVFCYVSMDDEVDTRRLIADMLQEGKRVAVPRCSIPQTFGGSMYRKTWAAETAEEQESVSVGAVAGRGYMEACEISSFADLESGAYGILEPKEFCHPVMPETIDLCIVPCLCVGSSGVRLGYGGGYYDRYLTRLGTGTVCAALCRERTQGAEPPAEPHDRPVDMVITEKQIMVCRNTFLQEG